ncbi:MAG: 4'-phosphopantetheinyl transferase superfamily protein [Prevotellaceae bacterium]|jgi:phosphopantetheine--protein transferase-like protein|nr:4'-phosphopantetheinyl transferase superfamily protein [Prevotellaceae bacterium]
MDTLISITNYQWQITYRNAMVVVCALPSCEEREVFPFSEEEKIEFAKIKSEKRRAEFIGTRLALEKLLGYKPQINHNAHGKPLLANGTAQISLSHSKDLVAAMMHRTNAVGIDVEPVAPKIERLAEKFLTDNEQQNAPQNEDKALYYTICWAAKEAAYKIIGTSAVDFKTMDIKPFEPHTDGEIGLIHLEKEYRIKYKTLQQHIVAYGISEK